MRGSNLSLTALLLLGGCTWELGFVLADRGDEPRKPLEFTAPVNLPPENYTGEIWVDRDGCVFLRSGAEWVPRVNQKRIQICDRAAMISYLENSGRGDEVPGGTARPEGETALSVEQALAKVAAEDPTLLVKPEPLGGTTPDLLTQSFVQLTVTGGDTALSEARTKFEDREIVVFGATQATGSLVLGPFTDPDKLQDALVTAWSFGYLDAFTFEN